MKTKFIKYSDGRRHNGGKRQFSGRLSKNIRESIIDALQNQIVVKEFRHGQGRRVRRSVLYILLQKLFKKGMAGNVKSIHYFLDIAYGPAVDPSKRSQPDGSMILTNPKKLAIIAKNAEYMTIFKILEEQIKKWEID